MPLRPGAGPVGDPQRLWEESERSQPLPGWVKGGGEGVELGEGGGAGGLGGGVGGVDGVQEHMFMYMYIN